MKLLVKEGVILREVNPWFLQTCQKVMELGTQWGYTPTITSLTDGKHKSNSFHYRHLAMDLRSNDLPESRREEFKTALKDALGANYDVILEKDHYHIEPGNPHG